MGQVIFIVWRESVEALLIIGVLYAWLSATPGAARGKRWLAAGVIAGLALAGVLAAGIYMAESLFGEHQDVFETAMVLIASGLIVQMVWWMRAHGRTMKRDLEQGLSQHMQRQSWWGVLALSALAIAREGSETVVFLYGTLSSMPSADLPTAGLAALTGLALALATFLLLQLGGKVLNWQTFFRATEVMLLLLAAALFTSGIEKLQMMGWLPALQDALWDSSAVLDDMSRAGGVVSALTGYRAQPSLMTVLAWGAYWLVMLGFFFRPKRPSKTAASSASQTA